MEHGILSISDWMFNNKLKLNEEKTEFIIFSSSHNAKHIKVESLDLNNIAIPRANVVRNLGVQMDTQLNMTQHVNDVKKRCFYYIRWIWSIRHLLTTQATKYVVHALVISRLDYCNIVLYGLPKSVIRDLQLVLNAAARLVLRCPRDTPTNQILKDLHWLPIEQRIQFKLICLTFKGLYDQAPDYIYEMLVPYSQTRRLRSCSKQLLAVQRTNLKYGNRAFSIAAPKLRNSLPDDIRTIKSFPLFKKRLKTYLFTNAF